MRPEDFRRALAGERCVVVGGAGSVGGLFADRFLREGAHVCIIDRVAPALPPLGTTVLVGDITHVEPEMARELGRADLVMLAVPERVALAAVGALVPCLRPDALLADTLSVKRHVVDLVEGIGGTFEVVSLNPMFAPSLDPAGRAVAAVVVRDGPRAASLLELISSWGARVVRVTADEHDRLAAATQALTHAAVLAFGLALADLAPDIDKVTAVAPPPHAALLALLARIVSSEPETYWDVQAANPLAPAARAALKRGASRLGALIDSGEEAAFRAVLAGLAALLEPHLPHHRDTCSRIFAGGMQLTSDQ